MEIGFLLDEAISVSTSITSTWPLDADESSRMIAGAGVNFGFESSIMMAGLGTNLGFVFDCLSVNAPGTVFVEELVRGGVTARKVCGEDLLDNVSDAGVFELSVGALVGFVVAASLIESRCESIDSSTMIADLATRFGLVLRFGLIGEGVGFGTVPLV